MQACCFNSLKFDWPRDAELAEMLFRNGKMLELSYALDKKHRKRSPNPLSKLYCRTVNYSCCQRSFISTHPTRSEGLP